MVVPVNASLVIPKSGIFMKMAALVGFVMCLAVAILILNYPRGREEVSSPKRSEEAERSLSVETASPEQLQKVNLALRNKHSVSKALTVRSQSHKSAYYVGASFSVGVVGGVEEVVGIWIMGGEKNAPNTVASVDGVAYQFSGMGQASDSKIGASVVDREAKALQRALTK
jgi:hypothetical protein